MLVPLTLSVRKKDKLRPNFMFALDRYMLLFSRQMNFDSFRSNRVKEI